MNALTQQSGPAIQWQKTYGGSGIELIEGAILDIPLHAKMQVLSRDKNYFFVGGTTRSNDGDIGQLDGHDDQWVAKVDLIGNLIWKIKIPGIDYDNLSCIYETSDGHLLVLGWSYFWPVGGTHDAMLTKIAPDGSVVWKKYYGLASETDAGHSIIETSDGDYVFIGGSHASDLDQIWIVKMNSNGMVLWTKKVAGLPPFPGVDGLDEGVDIKEDAFGNLYFGAMVRDVSNPMPQMEHYEILVGKMSSLNGDLIWTKIFKGLGDEIVYNLELDMAGNPILAGYITKADGDIPGPELGQSDAYIMKLDTAGNMIFFKRYGGSVNDDIRDLKVLSDNSYLVVGRTNSSDGYLAGDEHRWFDAWVARIDSQGNIMWARKYGGTQEDVGNSIDMLPDSSYVFSGTTASNDYDVSGSNGSHDFWLVKLDKEILSPPDIELTSSLGVSEANIGESINPSLELINNGEITARNVNVAIYLSWNDVLNVGWSGDILVDSFSIPEIPGNSSTGLINYQFSVPCTYLAPYYLFIVTDLADNIPESDESNNLNIHTLLVEPMKISITPSEPLVCNSNPVTLIASGAENYTWSPSAGLNTTSGDTVIANPTQPITYTVTGSNSTCTDTETVSVAIDTASIPSISISYSGCPGNSINFQATISNGGQAPLIEWYQNNSLAGFGDNFTLSNAMNNDQVYAKLTSSLPCAFPQTVTSSTISINCNTTSLPSINGVENILISPNPSKGFFTIQIKLNTSKYTSILIKDVWGRNIYKKQTQFHEGINIEHVNLSNQPEGIYFATIYFDNQAYIKTLYINK